MPVMNFDSEGPLFNDLTSKTQNSGKHKHRVLLIQTSIAVFLAHTLLGNFVFIQQL